MIPKQLHRFEIPIEENAPESFNFPFYYVPNSLAILAAEQLQRNYLSKNPWKHNFGLDPKLDGIVIGKMFGVLVVRDSEGELGFLAGFSGKLADSNHHPGFVPPVFDILDKKGFFLKGEEEVSAMNQQIEAYEDQIKPAILRQELNAHINSWEKQIIDLKKKIKAEKAKRDSIRANVFPTLNEIEQIQREKELQNESIALSYSLKRLKAEANASITELKNRQGELLEKLEGLKEKRKIRSNQLQKQIFDHYTFLNARAENKSLLAIFNELGIELPPAGAGECAAPKLLQFAYLHKLTPVTFAEFWWGASPKSEVRKHGEFYPSCRGKCEPILGHMLQGIAVDPNPMLTNPAEGKDLEILYEDDSIIVINKPEEFLSVPGINISDSVQTRLKSIYSDSEAPLLVHRLDMSTSGLLIAAKSERAYAFLQRQFIKRTVNKRYVAILEGEVQAHDGSIILPLRVDLDNRPQQLVCYEHGKPAWTDYEVIGVKNGKTLIHFFPKSGRTHQLRVHAAHQDGLNAPIVGDDLYGKPSDRLHLHAEFLEFIHPDTKERIQFFQPHPFQF